MTERHPNGILVTSTGYGTGGCLLRHPLCGIAQEGTLSIFLVRGFRQRPFCRTETGRPGPADEQKMAKSPKLCAASGFRPYPGSLACRPRAANAPSGGFKAVLPQELRSGGTEYGRQPCRRPSWLTSTIVVAAPPQSAFTLVAGIELELLPPAKHEWVAQLKHLTFKAAIPAPPPSACTSFAVSYPRACRWSTMPTAPSPAHY